MVMRTKPKLGKYNITKNGIVCYHRHIVQDVLGSRLSTSDLKKKNYIEYLPDNPYFDGYSFFIPWMILEKRIKELFNRHKELGSRLEYMQYIYSKKPCKKE